MRPYINEKGKLCITANNNELCIQCTNQEQCPLVQAFFEETIIARYGEVIIKKCGFFAPKKLQIPNWLKFGKAK